MKNRFFDSITLFLKWRNAFICFSIFDIQILSLGQFQHPYYRKSLRLILKNQRITKINSCHTLVYFIYYEIFLGTRLNGVLTKCYEWLSYLPQIFSSHRFPASKLSTFSSCEFTQTSVTSAPSFSKI